eukprot:2578924-Pleurochrysis_carterae.AAC.1
MRREASRRCGVPGSSARATAYASAAARKVRLNMMEMIEARGQRVNAAKVPSRAAEEAPRGKEGAAEPIDAVGALAEGVMSARGAANVVSKKGSAARAGGIVP